MSYRAPMNPAAGMSPSALRATIRARPGTYFAGIRAARAGLGAGQQAMSPAALRAMIRARPGTYFAGIRAARAGLGQTKPGATTPDHTATDWATALTTAGTVAAPIIGAATGQQQAAPVATTATVPVTDTSGSTDWYWPAIGAVGVLTVGGILYMVTKKPAAKASPAKVAANRRRSRKNGWRRKASRGLKGKRRSRSKRSY